MDMNNEAFQAALRTFAQSHPDAAQWLEWLWGTFQDNSARLTAIEVAQEETRAIQEEAWEHLHALKVLTAQYNALAERYADLQMLYAARVAVDEAEEED